jgi:hypothetical protein
LEIKVDLTRDDILKAPNVKIEKVFVPDWGGDVYIHQLSARDQDKYEQAMIDKKGAITTTNARARLIVAALHNKDGSKMFTEDDLEALSDKSGAVLNSLIDKVSALNSVTPEDLEELAKN